MTTSWSIHTSLLTSITFPMPWEEIRSAWQLARTGPHPPSEETIRDTTAHRAATSPLSATASPTHTPVPAESSPAGTSLLSRDRLSIPGNRLSALLKPFSTSSSQSSQSSQVTVPAQCTRSPSEEIAGASTKVPSPLPDHTYPPSTVQLHSSHGGESGAIKYSWNVPVPSWLRNQSRRLFSMGTGADEAQSEVPGVYTSISPSSSEHNELGFSILDGVESGTADPVAVEKFRTTFALDEKETLIAGMSFPMNTMLSLSLWSCTEFPGYLFRVLPVFGKVDISTNYFCFRSSHPLTKTRVSTQ
jgi:sterol 3beta-glucosyltransferase